MERSRSSDKSVTTVRRNSLCMSGSSITRRQSALLDGTTGRAVNQIGNFRDLPELGGGNPCQLLIVDPIDIKKRRQKPTHQG